MTLPALHKASIEWQTVLAIIACYALWGLVIYFQEYLGWFWLIPATLLATFHSSLQHEALHGHPTRSKTANEALLFFPLGLLIPYRRFRALHLRHHNNDHLTDPYEDPESWYWSEDEWDHRSTLLKVILEFNATLCGRLLVGPALMLIGFASSELKLIGKGNLEIIKAWVLHSIGVMVVLWILYSTHTALTIYVPIVSYFAISLIMIRSYIEHRAVEKVSERTAIVESGRFMSLLFLNNNLHSVHHMMPCAPWYQLSDVWRLKRESILGDNNGYYYPGGYAEVFRKWFFTKREPVIYPLTTEK